MSKQVAVIDIGTTGIRILVAKINETGIPHIIAKSQVSSNARKKFEIEDESLLTDSIKSALKKIRDQTGIIIKTAYISISGDCLKFLSNSDSIAISDNEGDITSAHVGQVLDKTASVEIYDDELLVDIIPLTYYVDGKPENDPLGLVGNKLSVEAKVVLGSKEYIEKLTACVNNAGLQVDGYVPFFMAMGELLSESEVDEEEQSTLLVDVGGQVTEYVIYYKGKPFLFGAVPVGGDSITNDLAQVFKISLSEAETIKKDYPLATLEVLSNNIDVAIFSLESGTQEILKVAQIVEVMQARIENIFEIVKDRLEEEDVETQYIDRVILTGDGITKFKGVDKVSESIFETKFAPIDFSRLTGMKSVFTNASGMLMYIAMQLPLGRKESVFERVFLKENVTAVKSKEKSGFAKFMDKLKDWVSSFKE